MLFGLIGFIVVSIAIALLVVIMERDATGRYSPPAEPSSSPTESHRKEDDEPSWAGDLRVESPKIHGSWLVVETGADRGRTYLLGERSVTIGRGISSSVQLSDSEVSRSHSHIRWTGESYEVVDMESGNGTWVDAARVERRMLRSGDRLTLGRTVLRYVTDAVYEKDHTLGRKGTGRMFEVQTSEMAVPEVDCSGESSQERDAEIARLTRLAGRGIPDNELLDEVSSSVLGLLDADRMVILSRASSGWEIHSFRHAVGIQRELLRVQPDKILMSRVVQACDGLRTRPGGNSATTLHAAATPIFHGEESVGVLYADRVGEGRTPFERDVLDFLESVASVMVGILTTSRE